MADQMNVKKLFLIVAAVISGITLFMPLYFLKGEGIVLNIPKEYNLPVPLMPTVYGFAILICAILIVIFTITGIKPGYIIASLVDSLLSIITVIIMSDKAHKDPALLFEQVGNAMSDYIIDEVRTGPAFYIIILAAVLVLGAMMANAVAIGRD